MFSRHILSVVLTILFLSLPASAQGTGFNFQGRLNDGANAANGAYDLQFRLYDAIAGGTQIFAVSSRPNTTVINGVFSVTLDFGATAFNTPNSIFIEIAVRPNGSPNAYTILGPRQQLTVVPYAVRAASAANADNAANAVNAQNSVNATNSTNAATATNSFSLGGVAAGSYLQTNGNGSQLTNVNAVTAANATTANNALNLGGVAPAGWMRLNVSNAGGLILTDSLQVGGATTLGGNVTQAASSNGLVKAMIAVNASGEIARCYNGITNSSTGNCNFVITEPLGGVGVFRINFGFPVAGRFVAVTPRYQQSAINNRGANYREFDSVSIEVFTFSAGNPTDTLAGGFTIILF